jgi:hypothetical protein
MSKKSTTKNEVSWSPPPKTQAVSNLEGLVDQGEDYATPIRNAYARADQDIKRSYNNPLGGYTTATVRDRSYQAQKKDLAQNLGMDLANAAQNSAQAKFGRQATVAGFTQPQMYNSQSTQKVSDPWGTAIGFAGAGSNLATGLMGGSKK